MLDDIYNAKILEFAGNIPRIGRLADPDATARAAFAALRLDRHRRREDGGRAGFRLRP